MAESLLEILDAIRLEEPLSNAEWDWLFPADSVCPPDEDADELTAHWLADEGYAQF